MVDPEPSYFQTFCDPIIEDAYCYQTVMTENVSLAVISMKLFYGSCRFEV